MIQHPVQFFISQLVVLFSLISQIALIQYQINSNMTGSRDNLPKLIQESKGQRNNLTLLKPTCCDQNSSQNFSQPSSRFAIVLLSFINRFALARQQIDSYTTGSQKKIGRVVCAFKTYINRSSSKYFSALQLYCSCLSIVFLSYDSRSPLILLD